jgi:hypothetical protein
VGTADIDGMVAGASVYRGHMPGHIVEESGRSGPAHVVAEEAEVLWTPAAPSACFALARRRWLDVAVAAWGGGPRWWRWPELVPRQPEQGRDGGGPRQHRLLGRGGGGGSRR